MSYDLVREVLSSYSRESNDINDKQAGNF